jgi:hypothetical protein
VTPEVQTLLKQLEQLQSRPPATRSKGFWSKMKEVLGA